MFYTSLSGYRDTCTIAFNLLVLQGGEMTQPREITIEIVLGEKVVRAKRAQLALLKRKPIVLEEFEEREAGEVFLGEISSNEK